MSKLIILIKGEFQRLQKYNMLKINFVILIFFLVIAYFLEGEEAKQFIPFIIMIDASMMTTLLVGATLFYEKKEHTMNTLIVTPVTEDEILLGKILVSILNNIISILIIGIGMYFMKGIYINILPLIFATILVSTFHTIVGILLSYKSKDFTGLLMGYIGYVFIFMFPTLLIMGGIIDPEYSKYFIAFPPEASNILFTSTIKNTENWKIIFSLSYLITLSLLLYRLFIKPHFHNYAIKEVGV